MFFLATADAEGRPQCSYKGGEPGFVRVLDERTLAFPSYDGNGMYLSAGNVLVNPHVGLLFIDFERGSGCGSRATPRSPTTTRCSPTTRRRSSWCGSRRRRSSRTARATSTATGWSGARASSRARTASRRCPSGSPGLGVRRPPRARPGPRSRRRSDRAIAPRVFASRRFPAGCGPSSSGRSSSRCTTRSGRRRATSCSRGWPARTG